MLLKVESNFGDLTSCVVFDSLPIVDAFFTYGRIVIADLGLIADALF